jgi:formylglycine-generating enzyme required for sulfatase activity
MRLLPGELLNKRYRIVSLLAEGQYGAVYRAWDVQAKRDCAIKEYLDPSVEIQKRFRAEARRLSDLNHPQLPAVLDHFVLEETGQYLVSAYVDGVDLQSLLAQYGRLPSDRIIEWLQAVSIPLTYLHNKKQLHLNLKPANIRLTPAGDVFLVDTGLPGLGVSIGASGYAAPEQQMQASVSSLSDIYSLGATLYALLTGQAPPDALRRESGLATLVPAREVNPDVEPYLSVVASRAMDLNPEVRYESAEEFANALNRPAGRPTSDTRSSSSPPRRAGTGRTSTTPPPPRLPTRTRKQIEQRTIWGLLAVLLIVIGMGIGVSWAGRSAQLPEGGEAAATATLQSQIIAALTAITTLTPTPIPSETPTPSPEPLLHAETGARLIYMPPGSFRMGNDEGDNDEKPSHITRLDGFFMDETEVTNAQYAACVADEVCSPPDRPGATYHPAYYGDPAYDNYPVIFVSWHDANTFCEWRGARLPSEAEWEKAAGFDPNEQIKLRYPWGDAFDGLLLNFCDENCNLTTRTGEFDDGWRDTAPVRTYEAGRSPIGVYDMAGNVMEWVADWYAPRAYQNVTENNPLGPAEGQFKVIRGGSWLSDPVEVTVTDRENFDPTVSRAHLGFRCAMNPP